MIVIDQGLWTREAANDHISKLIITVEIPNSGAGSLA